jgi:death on curing protein
MRYISMHEALFIHSTLLKAHGGADGVRDGGLIEAALLRPQTGHYADLIEEAAALWESLSMHHGFVDGNKRVGFACMELFLDLNQLETVCDQDEVITFIYHHLEAGTFTKDVLDTWLRANTAKL